MQPANLSVLVPRLRRTPHAVASRTQHSQERSSSEAERKAYLRARKRAAREAGFYVHLMWYGIVIGFLPAGQHDHQPRFEWWWHFPGRSDGVSALVSHFAAVYGWGWIRQRVFEPAIQREVQREVTNRKRGDATEKQASLDELTASFAHEIRNPIAAAKSLVQQMGEDPTSSENVEYAKVALDELARVERSVSHLLKYAKEEDYRFDNVNLAGVLDAAMTQMRGKLEANHVSVSRNYIGGPTVRADADKLRQVFTNVIDNAIDAMESNAGERRLEIGIRALQSGNRDRGDSRQRHAAFPRTQLSKIFNPFYTTKTNGTGLGWVSPRKSWTPITAGSKCTARSAQARSSSISIPLADALRAGRQDRIRVRTASADSNGNYRSAACLPPTAPVRRRTGP